mmetsp:Transcript_28752/g.83995  ORF Transcript_28752/g.83995 Transcript_28752/m.83995 type:complete len:225 (-) Transcript_28752:56-730(-)
MGEAEELAAGKSTSSDPSPASIMYVGCSSSSHSTTAGDCAGEEDLLVAGSSSPSGDTELGLWSLSARSSLDSSSSSSSPPSSSSSSTVAVLPGRGEGVSRVGETRFRWRRPACLRMPSLSCLSLISIHSLWDMAKVCCPGDPGDRRCVRKTCSLVSLSRWISFMTRVRWPSFWMPMESSSLSSNWRRTSPLTSFFRKSPENSLKPLRESQLLTSSLDQLMTRST